MILIKLIKVIKKPKLILAYFLRYRPFRLLSDKTFLSLEYYLRMDEKLDLDNPKTFNEKLQWLKLYNRKPQYTKLVDKYEVRNIVKEKIGTEFLIPIYGVYDNYEQIDFSKLPNQFVLKPTHTSGNVYICKDKTSIDHKKLKLKVEKWLKREYFWIHREWPYKDVKPRIVAEKYMVDESGFELKDYKFFCFNGKPELLYVATDRFTETKFDFFDLNFNHIPVKQNYDNNIKKNFVKPDNFSKMIEFSKVLSCGIPHVRVDFYNINGKIYFGELTFYHESGLVKFNPEKYDRILGDLLQLPQDNKL